MIDSVEKYGGFYIGRYETGNVNQEQVVVQKGNTNIWNTTWYNAYEKCKTLSDNNNNIETGLIWGNQWDRTLMWLIESGAKTKEVIRNSTSWGNYRNATFTYTNSSGSTATKNQNSVVRIPTGSTEYTKANNIYDLAGNAWEWTMEAYSFSDYRLWRGGFYDNDGSNNPASYRYFGYPFSNDSLNPYRFYNASRLQGNTLYKVATSTLTGNVTPATLEPEA